jgi:predicted transcriptional regulator
VNTFSYYNSRTNLEVQTMRAVALTFRADADFASQVDHFAQSSGVSRSDYVRQAVEEKNARALAERMVFLSQTLSAKHEQINQEMEDSIGDGLAGR